MNNRIFLFGVLVFVLFFGSGCVVEIKDAVKIKSTDTQAHYPQKEWLCPKCEEDDKNCPKISCTTYGDCPYVCNERCIEQKYDGGNAWIIQQGGRGFLDINNVYCTCLCFNR